MKWHIGLLAGLLGVALLGPPVWAQGYGQPAAPLTASAQPADQTRSAIEAIRQANDPSAAVAAYAAGAAMSPNDPQLLDAYVSKMVAFGLPEAAYQQAQRLVDVDPNNGVAWAVLAYMAARQGQMAEALADLAQAGNRSPDDRFVQETAGQLLAWYDQNKPAVSDSLRDSLEKVRRAMANQKAFVDAYRDAQQDLRQARAATTQPLPQGQPYYGPAETTAQPTPEPVYPQQYSYTPLPGMYDSYGYGSLGYSYYPSYLGYGYNYYPTYPYGIYYPSYAYPSYAYGYDWPWWGGGFGYWPWRGPSWWWGRNNTFVFNFDDFDHFDHFDKFRHHGKFGLADLLHKNRFFKDGFHDRGRHWGTSGTWRGDRTRFVDRGSNVGVDQVRRTAVARDGLQQRTTLASPPRSGVDRSSARIFRSGSEQARLTFRQPSDGTAVRRAEIGSGAGGSRQRALTTPQRQMTSPSASSLQRSASPGRLTSPSISGRGTPGTARLEATPRTFGSGGVQQAVPRVSPSPRGGSGMGGSIARPSAPRPAAPQTIAPQRVAPQRVAPQTVTPRSFSPGRGASPSVPRYSAPSRGFGGGGAPAARSYSGGMRGSPGISRGGGGGSRGSPGISRGGGGGGSRGGPGISRGGGGGGSRGGSPGMSRGGGGGGGRGGGGRR